MLYVHKDFRILFLSLLSCLFIFSIRCSADQNYGFSPYGAALGSLDPSVEKGTNALTLDSEKYEVMSDSYSFSLWVRGKNQTFLEGLAPFDYNRYVSDKNSYLNHYMENFVHVLNIEGVKQFSVSRSVEIKGTNNVIIFFNQLEDNLEKKPRYRHINFISFDKKTKKISEVRLRVFFPTAKLLNWYDWKTEAEAQALAKSAWKNPNSNELTFNVVENFISSELHPFRRFYNNNYVFDVDLFTGNVIINRNRAFITDYYEDATNGSPDVITIGCKEVNGNGAVGCFTVEENGSVQFWEKISSSDSNRSVFSCWKIPNGCTNYDLEQRITENQSLIDAYVFLDEWEKDTKDYTENIKSDDYPDIDIVGNSTAKEDGVPIAAYVNYPLANGRFKGIIISPKKGTHPKFKSNVEPLQSREFIIHEAAHSEMDYLTQGIFLRSDRPLMKALGEAIADMKGLLTPGKYAPSEEGWVFGKTLFKEEYLRDYRQPRSFGDLDPDASEYENALVFGHFFYQLAHREGISTRKLLQLITILPGYVALRVQNDRDMTVEDLH